MDVASAPITITAAAPPTPPDVDLVVSSATAPPTAVAGQSVPITFTVDNQGTDAATSAWYDYVYLSSTPTVNNYSLYLGDYANASSLTGGTSYTQQETVTLPTSAAGGNEYLIFLANDAGQDGGQAEINYNNDSYAVPITVSEPNLSVTAASFTGAAIEGDQVNVSWTVKNVGNAAASGSWYDAVYLSDSPVPRGVPVEIRSFYEGGESPLAPRPPTRRARASRCRELPWGRGICW